MKVVELKNVPIIGSDIYGKFYTFVRVEGPSTRKHNTRVVEEIRSFQEQSIEFSPTTLVAEVSDVYLTPASLSNALLNSADLEPVLKYNQIFVVGAKGIVRLAMLMSFRFLPAEKIRYLESMEELNGYLSAFANHPPIN